MNITLKLVLASIVPCALILGCNVPVDPAQPEGAERVGSAEQELPSNEVTTLFFSDATFSQYVGKRTLNCDGRTSRTGSTSDFYYQESAACENTFPFDDSGCYVCSSNQGQYACFYESCPPTIQLPPGY